MTRGSRERKEYALERNLAECSWRLLPNPLKDRLSIAAGVTGMQCCQENM